MRLGGWLCGLCVLLLGIGLMVASPSNDDAVAADSGAGKGKVLRHLVLYKFKDDQTAEQVQEVVDTFNALPGKISTIIDFEHGTNVSPEGKSEGLTHSFLVTFRDEKGRDRYLEHPAHLDYVNVVKDRREKVVVFDYWTDEKK